MLSPSKLACDSAALTASCPYCYHFLALFFVPLSPVWVANVRPAVVLFYDLALLVLRLICPHLCFMPDDGTHQPHLYLIVSITPPSLDLISSAFSYHHYPVAVCSASLALAPIVCSYYFLPLTLFVVYIFYSTFLLLFCLYSPLDRCPPVILCYLTCISSRRH